MWFYDYEFFVGSELLSFDGLLGLDCELIKGLMLDFNLMYLCGYGYVEV